MVTPAIRSMNKISGLEIDALTISPQIAEIMKSSGLFSKVHMADLINDSFIKSLRSLYNIRKINYDLSILVYPSNHYKYNIAHFLTGGKKRYGIKYSVGCFPDLSFLSGSKLDENRNLHAIEQNFRLFETALETALERVYKMTLKISDNDETSAESFINQNDLKNKILIGIHPGSDVMKNMAKKRWSREKYGGLIRHYSKISNIRFLVFGGPKEKELCNNVCSMSPSNSMPVLGKNFLASAAIIKKCSLFVSGDTGLMHTASALGVPVVSIFGPTSPVYAGPTGETSKIVMKNYPCVPCYEYSRKPLVCSQKRPFKCLDDIGVEEVAQNIDNILNIKEISR